MTWTNPPSSPHAGAITNDYGVEIGRVDARGNIKNQYNTTVGRVGTRGKVFDDLGYQKGKIDTSGNLYDNYNQKLPGINFTNDALDYGSTLDQGYGLGGYSDPTPLGGGGLGLPDPDFVSGYA
jgi:hypothetical protein